MNVALELRTMWPSKDIAGASGASGANKPKAMRYR